jgi:hypothetical protein
VNAQRFQGARKGVREEIEVFEDPENRKIQHKGEDEPLSAMWIDAAGSDFLGDQKIYRCTPNHEREEAPVPPAIEEVARQEQKDILGALIQPPVQQDNWDQKDEIGWRIKKHSAKSNRHPRQGFCAGSNRGYGMTPMQDNPLNRGIRSKGMP